MYSMSHDSNNTYTLFVFMGTADSNDNSVHPAIVGNTQSMVLAQLISDQCTHHHVRLTAEDLADSDRFLRSVRPNGIGIVMTGTCPDNWFGPKCQYKCHCQENNCKNGSCPKGCEKGWFGPQCQYVNLVTGRLASELDTEGCIVTEVNKTLLVSFAHETLFTWMRLEFKEKPMEFNFELLKDDNSWITCAQVKMIKVNDLLMDVVCNNTKHVSKGVSLHWTRPEVLCNVYVSGGRNVALKAAASQTSTFQNATFDESYGMAQHAVDGNTESDYRNKSCSQTEHHKKKDQNLLLTFAHPQRIYGFRIFNEKHSTVAIKFLIQLFDSEHESFDYYDVTLMDPVHYRAIGNASETAHYLRVRAGKQVNSEKYILICELEVFGDSDCKPGTYGLDCENNCRCLNSSDVCFSSTGGCASGCIAGYSGEDCNSFCPTGKYGAGCAEICPLSCGGDGSCNHINGTCLHQCRDGYVGDYCSQVCPTGKYGAGCAEICPLSCGGDGSCNHINGTCLHQCRDGYIGDYCSQVCPTGKYGAGCAEICPQSCGGDGSCNHINGTCLHQCRDGYMGDYCSQDSWTTKDTK
ncbi:hypothetical protein Btru_055226 [Bulinus truncatus]|nr:hypothetical protein Btru_055226 [Bulinus truncatus]